MIDEKCSECRYWHDGNCRMKPPVVIFGEIVDANFARTVKKFFTCWPETNAEDWCGEFRKPKPEDLDYDPVYGTG